jgi:hypothetical protein
MRLTYFKGDLRVFDGTIVYKVITDEREGLQKWWFGQMFPDVVINDDNYITGKVRPFELHNSLSLYLKKFSLRPQMVLINDKAQCIRNG